MLRRNRKKDDSAQQAVPAQQLPPETPAPSDPEKDNNSSGGGIFGWLRDSYNGIYKIVLEPSMPRRGTLFTMIVGVLIGLIWGYVLNPIIFTGANPNRLNQAAQDQWVKMIAVGFDTDSRYGIEQVFELLDQVDSPIATIDRLRTEIDPNTNPFDYNALTNLRNALADAQISGTPTPASPGIAQEIASGLLVPIVAAIVITIVFLLVWRLLIYDNLIAPVYRRMRETPEERIERQRAEEERERIRQQRALANQMKEDAAKEASDLGPPVMNSVSIYQKGRAYDDSMEIELPIDQGGAFLGQTGAVIAETVAPDPVAVEVWLFDMRSGENLKQVLATPTAVNDPTVMSRVQSDPDLNPNDIIPAQPGSTVEIESTNLILRAKLASVEIGGDGRFENFQMQIQAWQKADQPVAAPGGGFAAPPPPTPQPSQPPAPPTGGRPMSDYDDLQFDPPPVPPAGGRPMSDYDNLQFDPPPVPPAQGGRPMSDYDNLQFDPPPVPPAQGGQPPSPQDEGGRLTPPPMNYPPGMVPPGYYDDDDDDEEDPFGGTGDFTPLGRP